MDMPQTKKRQVLRQELWAILHRGHGRLGHAFNFFLIIVILLSVAIVPFEFFQDDPEFTAILHGIEAVIVSLFTVEYALRIYAAPNRVRYVFSFFGIVDLLSIIPFYAGIFGTEYVRILRFVRFLKIAEIESAAQYDEEAVMQKGIGLVEGENVEYVVTKSPVILFLGIVPPTIAIASGLAVLFFSTHIVAITLILALFFFALLFLWKAWLDFSYDVLYITNFRLIFQNQHVLGRSINQVQYNAITNVKPFYPNAVSYIMRYGTLVIDTAAETPGQISINLVRNHEHAAHVIMQKCFGERGGNRNVGIAEQKML